MSLSKRVLPHLKWNLCTFSPPLQLPSSPSSPSTLLPSCLTDLPGSFTVEGDNPRAVTKPESDITKHPICGRRERLVVLSRLIPRWSLLCTPRTPHVGFYSHHHHLPFRHNPHPVCVHSRLIFYIRWCILHLVLSNLRQLEPHF